MITMTRLFAAAALILAMTAPSYAQAPCKMDLTDGKITCEMH
jgi:hypothetical protein